MISTRAGEFAQGRRWRENLADWYCLQQLGSHRERKTYGKKVSQNEAWLMYVRLITLGSSAAYVISTWTATIGSTSHTVNVIQDILETFVLSN